MQTTSLAGQLRYIRVVSVLIGLLSVLGLLGLLFSTTSQVALSLSPWLVLLGGGLSLFPIVHIHRKPLAVWLALTFIVIFVLLALATSSGRIFGPYQYGPSLGWGPFDVPLLSAFNWVLVLYAATRFAQSRLQGTSGVVGESIVAVCTGVLIMLYEWALVPVAQRLNIWRFDSGEATWRFYLGWFVIGSVSAFTYLYFLKPRLRIQDGDDEGTRLEKAGSRLVGLFAFCQLLGFLVLRIVWAIGGR